MNLENDLNKLVIRKAVVEDVKTILDLIKELASYEKLLDQVVTTEEQLREVLFGENSFVEVWLAEYDNKIAGQVLFFHNFSTFVGRPGLYIEDLYVHPHLRGNGIGKQLLAKVVEIAKERNCGRVEWLVIDWNKPAIDFYKSVGAVPLDEWTVFRLTEDKFDNLLD